MKKILQNRKLEFINSFLKVQMKFNFFLNNRIGWYCLNCNEYYDLKIIEFSLIEALHSKIMSHVTQDIKCQKCNEVRAGFLQKYCECTGLYENLVTNEEMSQLIKALKNFVK
jgi:hypothetical protein